MRKREELSGQTSTQTCASTTIPTQCQSEGEIAFNVRYLLEYLAGKDGIVILSTDGPSAPGLFSYRGVPHVVLMPMFVDSDGKTKTATPSAVAEASAKEKEVAQEPEPGEEEHAPGVLSSVLLIQAR